ncbi:bifunctional 3'-5' exonuclease/DNA polymerase [Geodermatophilus obscurus]|uniref:DNA-directed DNA polymerase n=1 Tax=Geodermatophilus obscurus (strain ATCC 25078 / DSM 43160 / JCM 3152 / CCUG 61914 / KCC A-0152 / KCTC 9177 / NBRC 13315 / NRRL B-3577 / G-20) TaxID=526225 RepID=D2S6N3_GEOOG|nr:bifunctional 3'-5' exonuclease/DNA polymerase [Geodermatophilus obscurus]ADB75407.1 DNA-directed DNA polymerase [Geodermatophilus obscurus DSM 43160]
MNRVVLRRAGDVVEARELTEDGTAVGVTRHRAGELAAVVADRERTPVRWVWDDTTRWYPGLLDAGVRVERCTDLRLTHAVLRRSPFVDQALLAAGETADWDALQPVSAPDPALFPLDDPADTLDPVAEHGRQQAAVAASAEPHRLALLLAAESSGALVAAEMTHAGLPWRADVHARLLTELLGPRPASGARPAVLEALAQEVRAALRAPGLNPDSPGALLAALQAAGLPVEDTRSWTLEQLDHPVVGPLLEYKRLARLLTANGWAWLDTWVRDGRFRSWFVPGGVVTGRWASNGGGALSVPTQVRPAAVADDGWRLVVADVAQLEPRVLAGMSGDDAMAEAARAADLYEGMVAAGTVETRAQAKVAILGAMYGATRGESGRIMPRLARRYPRAIGLVEQAARAGERGDVVHTLLGRGSPRPTGAWAERAVALGEPAEVSGSPEERDRARRAWGRFTRNFVVQGTGAEWALCWLADLRNRLWRLGGTGPLEQRPHLVFFLHDEVVVHTPEPLADAVAEEVRAAAATAGRLLFGGFPVDFPLDVSVVASWADAG